MRLNSRNLNTHVKTEYRNVPAEQNTVFLHHNFSSRMSSCQQRKEHLWAVALSSIQFVIGEGIVLTESQFWVEDMSTREKKSKQERRLKVQNS